MCVLVACLSVRFVDACAVLILSWSECVVLFFALSVCERGEVRFLSEVGGLVPFGLRCPQYSKVVF